MPVTLNLQEDKLTIFLSGEIDHHSAKGIRQQADSEIIRTHPKEIVLNFKAVTFMDSSGIGLIMGRYKLASSYGASVLIEDASSYLRRVMRLAGLDSIVTITQSDGKDKKEETK